MAVINKNITPLSKQSFLSSLIKGLHDASPLEAVVKIILSTPPSFTFYIALCLLSRVILAYIISYPSSLDTAVDQL